MKTNAGIRPQAGQVWVCRDGRTLEPDFLVAGDIGGVAAGLVPFGGATGGLATAAGFSFNSGTNALAAPGAVTAVGAISTSDTTASSSTTTGSGKFAGGVGIVGALNVGGNAIVTGSLRSDGGQIFAAESFFDFTAGGVSGRGQIRVVSNSGAGIIGVNQYFSGSTKAVRTGYVGDFRFDITTGAWTFAGTAASTTADAAATLVNLLTVGPTTTSVLQTTASSSAATGALVVAGGTGIGGAAYIGGTIHAEGGAIDWPTVLTLNARTSDGSDSGRVLLCGGGAASSSRGGLIQAIGNEFGSSVSGCVIAQIGDATSAYFAVNGNGGATFKVLNTGPVQVLDTTASTSSSTGSLVVSGGIGVIGSVYAGGSINAAATSTFPGIIANGISGAASLDMQPTDSYATSQYMNMLFSPKYNSGGGTTAVAAIRMQRTTTVDGNYDGIVSLFARATGGSLTETVRAMMPGSANQVGLQVYDQNSATLKQVTVGAVDSGGAGFRLLRIPN